MTLLPETIAIASIIIGVVAVIVGAGILIALTWHNKRPKGIRTTPAVHMYEPHVNTLTFTAPFSHFVLIRIILEEHQEKLKKRIINGEEDEERSLATTLEGVDGLIKKINELMYD